MDATTERSRPVWTLELGVHLSRMSHPRRRRDRPTRPHDEKRDVR